MLSRSPGKQKKGFQSLRSQKMDMRWRRETQTPVQTQLSGLSLPIHRERVHCSK